MQIAIGLYPGFTSLDAMGPYQVFQHIPGAEVVLCAEQTGELRDDAGHLRLQIERDLASVTAPDVVVIPGGPGKNVPGQPGSAIATWLEKVHPTTTWTTSVCTGALVLGAAGLLDGLPATTHWGSVDKLASFGASYTEQRVVILDEPHIATAAGVSSGIDLALALTGRLAGDDIARAIQLAIEYDPQPPYDSGSPTKAGPDMVELVRSFVG